MQSAQAIYVAGTGEVGKHYYYYYYYYYYLQTW